jgi:uncharacterized membrane protein
MSHENPRSLARIAGHPIHPMLVPFPIACFIGAFVTDLAYWATAEMQWANFSVWLLTAGLVMSVFAGLAGAIDFFGNRQIRRTPAGWPHVLGNVVALVLSIINAFVHSRDAYTSVVPEGLILSGVVVLLLMFSAWMGGSMVYRYGVGVRS